KAEFEEKVAPVGRAMDPVVLARLTRPKTAPVDKLTKTSWPSVTSRVKTGRQELKEGSGVVVNVSSMESLNQSLLIENILEENMLPALDTNGLFKSGEELAGFEPIQATSIKDSRIQIHTKNVTSLEVFERTAELQLGPIQESSQLDHHDQQAKQAAVRMQSAFRGFSLRKKLSIIDSYKTWNFKRRPSTASPLHDVSSTSPRVFLQDMESPTSVDQVLEAANTEEGDLSDPNTFSTRGLSLSHILALVKLWGGREALQGKSTADVCQLHLLPMTKDSGLSLCAQYALSKGEEYLAREANWFVSHAWCFSFLDVLDALQAFFKDRKIHQDSAILWFDLFSNSQHNCQLKLFLWWETTFFHAVQRIGNVVMVLQPWMNPIPLQRAWCIFELLACHQTNSRFHIALTQRERGIFLDALLTDAKQFHSMLAQTSCRNSVARDMMDRKAIFRVIRQSVGFAKLDQMVYETFSGWVVEQFRLNIQKLVLDELECAHWKVGLANFYVLQGCLDFAEPLYHSALDAQFRNLRESHPDTLLTKVALATLYVNQGKYDKAEALYAEAFEAQFQELGNKHPETIQTIIARAELEKLRGRYDTSESLYYDALNTQIAVLGNKHRETLTTANNLATLFVQQGRYDDALSLYNHCLEANIALLGNEHPDTLQTISNLSSLYMHQERLDEAKELSENCLNMQMRILGKENMATLTTMNTLGLIWMKQNRFDKAEQVFLECLGIRRKVSGTDHPETLTAMNNLALLYTGLSTAQGLYIKAERTFLDCLDIQIQRLTPEHPDALTTSYNLASLFVQTDRLDEALPLLENCLETQNRTLGESHFASMREYQKAESRFFEYLKLRKKLAGDSRETLHILNSLGFMYDSQSRFDSAERLYLQYHEGQKKYFGEHHPETLLAANNLGLLYIKQGKFEHAEPLLQHCFEEHRRAEDLESIEALTASNNLALLYFHQNRYRESLALFRECLNVEERVLGSEHPTTIASLSNLAHVLIKMDEFAEAASIYRNCLGVQIRRFGDEHPDTLIMIENLAYVLDKQGQMGSAERLYSRVREIQERMNTQARSLDALMLPGLPTRPGNEAGTESWEREKEAAQRTSSQLRSALKSASTSRHSLADSVASARRHSKVAFRGSDVCDSSASPPSRRASPARHALTNPSASEQDMQNTSASLSREQFMIPAPQPPSASRPTSASQQNGSAPRTAYKMRPVSASANPFERQVKLSGFEFRRNPVVEALAEKLIETRKEETEHLNRLVLLRLTNPWSSILNSELLFPEIAWKSVQKCQLKTPSQQEYRGSHGVSPKIRPKTAPNKRSSRRNEPVTPPTPTRKDKYFAKLAKPKPKHFNDPLPPEIPRPISLPGPPDMDRLEKLARPRTQYKTAAQLALAAEALGRKPHKVREMDPIVLERLTRPKRAFSPTETENVPKMSLGSQILIKKKTRPVELKARSDPNIFLGNAIVSHEAELHIEQGGFVLPRSSAGLSSVVKTEVAIKSQMLIDMFPSNVNILSNSEGVGNVENSIYVDTGRFSMNSSVIESNRNSHIVVTDASTLQTLEPLLASEDSILTSQQQLEAVSLQHSIEQLPDEDDEAYKIRKRISLADPDRKWDLRPSTIQVGRFGNGGSSRQSIVSNYSDMAYREPPPMLEEGEECDDSNQLNLGSHEGFIPLNGNSSCEVLEDVRVSGSGGTIVSDAKKSQDLISKELYGQTMGDMEAEAVIKSLGAIEHESPAKMEKIIHRESVLNDVNHIINSEADKKSDTKLENGNPFTEPVLHNAEDSKIGSSTKLLGSLINLTDANATIQEVNAAVTVQSAFRGYQTRKSLRSLTGSAKNSNERVNGTSSHSGSRTKLVRSRDEFRKFEGVTKHQSRGQLQGSKDLLALTDANATADEANAAVAVQSVFRGYQTRKALKSLNNSAKNSIDKLARSTDELQKFEKAKIQPNDVLQGSQELLALTDTNATTDEVNAAVAVQSAFRGYQTRKTLKSLNSSVKNSVDRVHSGDSNATSRNMLTEDSIAPYEAPQDMKRSLSSRLDGRIKSGSPHVRPRGELGKYKGVSKQSSQEALTASKDVLTMYLKNATKEEIEAAVVVQSVYRGYQIRKNLKSLNGSAQNSLDTMVGKTSSRDQLEAFRGVLGDGPDATNFASKDARPGSANMLAEDAPHKHPIQSGQLPQTFSSPILTSRKPSLIAAADVGSGKSHSTEKEATLSRESLLPSSASKTQSRSDLIASKDVLSMNNSHATDEEVHGAVALQSLFRGHKARKGLRSLNTSVKNSIEHVNSAVINSEMRPKPGVTVFSAVPADDGDKGFAPGTATLSVQGQADDEGILKKSQNSLSEALLTKEKPRSQPSLASLTSHDLSQ
ncbi:hypothetical protein BC830DRAFT_1080723, partial [Chytriomyces sp. MP71]